MTNITESPTYDAAVYQLATTDPVQGGAGGVSNLPAQALADRTAYLKVHMDAAEANIAALQAAVAAAPPTQAAGDETTHYATTAFVHRAQGGVYSVSVAPGGNITLSSDAWGCAVIILTGLLTSNANVIFPTRGDRWLVVNATTGAFTATCKTAAGSGVKVTQGLAKDVYCDGTNVLNASTDLANRPTTLHATATLAVGGVYTIDFSGGVYGVSLPASPQDGDQVVIRGNFATSALAVSRNGKLIADQNGVAQAADASINRNNASDVFTYVVPTTGSAYWLVTQG